MIEKINASEYSPFYEGYLQKVSQPNLIVALQESKAEFLKAVQGISSEKMDYAYAKGKWTIKEVIQHIIDTERIFSYRALRFARNDKSDLKGYDQDPFVKYSDANQHSKEALINDYMAVRNASISLFRSMTQQMLERIGSVAGNAMSCRVAGYIMVGHQKHHVQILNERYLISGSFNEFLQGN